jgi:hypothetical protein
VDRPGPSFGSRPRLVSIVIGRRGAGFFGAELRVPDQFGFDDSPRCARAAEFVANRLSCTSATSARSGSSSLLQPLCPPGSSGDTAVASPAERSAGIIDPRRVRPESGSGPVVVGERASHETTICHRCPLLVACEHSSGGARSDLRH